MSVSTLRIFSTVQFYHNTCLNLQMYGWGGGGLIIKDCMDGLFNLLHSKWAKLLTWSFAHSECNKNLQIYEINKSEYVPFKKYNRLCVP